MQTPDRPDNERLDTLRILYPIFKQEIYSRREAMMRITRWTAGLLAALLVIALYIGPALSPERPVLAAGLLSLAIGLITTLTLVQLRQHKARHTEAKKAVIRIEKALGLFEPGTYLPDEALYPEPWAVRPETDPLLATHTAVLILLATLTILALFITG